MYMIELMNNPVINKSKKFALKIVLLYKRLSEENHEYVLSKQVLRSGTSIGANARESQNAESKADFIHKLSISLKEADETLYWLELLHDAEYISNEEFDSLFADCKELVRILTAILKSSRDKQ